MTDIASPLDKGGCGRPMWEPEGGFNIVPRLRFRSPFPEIGNCYA